MGRAAGRKDNATYLAESRQRRADRARASAGVLPKLHAHASTLEDAAGTNQITSLLLAVNDQLRRVGDVVLSLEDACKDVFDASEQGNNVTANAVFRDSILAKTANKAQVYTFLRLYLGPFLKRSILIFEGESRLVDGEYQLSAGTEPRHFIRYDDRAVCCSSAVLLYRNAQGKFRSVVFANQAFDRRTTMLYHGGEIEGDGESVMESVFEAVNRQLLRAELAHKMRDAAVWRELVVTRARQMPRDVLGVNAPIAAAVVVANPHVQVNDHVALGKFLLKIIAEEVGMRIVIYKEATRTESKPIHQIQPHVLKHSGKMLISVESSSSRRQHLFQSVTPRHAPTARASIGESISMRQLNARDAERHNPGGRARRQQAWENSTHCNPPTEDAAHLIQNAARKMRDALRDDTMDVCGVCDEEEFRGIAEFRQVVLSDTVRTAWVRHASAHTIHGHATRAGTPTRVLACKRCAKELSENRLPWAWKFWAPLREVPSEVAGLNDLEWSLIAPVQCSATVYVANSNTHAFVPEGTNGTEQRVSKHNSFLYRSDVDASIERVVPRPANESGVIFVGRCHSARKDVVFPIRIDQTLAALHILRRDNPDAYRNVRVDDGQIRRYREMAAAARDEGRDPDHVFDADLTVLESDDVVDATFGRADASGASGTRSEQSSTTFMHALENEDDLRVLIANLLPQPRIPAVQHVNANVARDAPRLGGEDNRMANEYDGTGEETLAHAFLRLFYQNGAAPHVVRGRLDEAGWKSDFSAEAYKMHLFKVYDNGNRRFQRDLQFLFYTFNASNRQEINQVSARLASNETVETRVIRETADAIARDAQRAGTRDNGTTSDSNIAAQGQALLKRLGMSMNPKRGSPASSEHARSDVMAIIQSPVCGRPALFVTVNPADTLWPELFRRIVGDEEEKCLSQKQRQRLLASNPVLAARFYKRRLDLLFEHLIYGEAPIFGRKIVDHWYRIEFQFRGSPHAHCILWLEGFNVPDHVSSNDHAALFSLAELAGCTVHSELPDGFDFSGLRGDRNPPEFDPWDDFGGAFKPPRYKDYVTDLDHVARRDAIVDGDDDALAADQYALETAFQHHVCINNFCSRQGYPGCKRRYPRPTTEHTMLSKTKDDRGRYRASVQTPRNNRWLVPFNRHLLQAWRGNVDVQVITDPTGAAAYASAIARYSTKPDTPDNNDVQRALNRTLRAGHDADAPAKTLLSKAANAVLGQTPISAQRAAWYMLKFDFVSSSRTVKCIYIPKPPASCAQAQQEYDDAKTKAWQTDHGDLAILRPRRTLEQNGDADPAFDRVDACALGGVIDDYTQRPPEAENLTLRDFVQQYDRDWKKPTATARNDRLICGDNSYRRVKESCHRVLRVQPYVPVNATNGAYAWHVLVLDTAWRRLSALVLENETIVDALTRQMPRVAEHARAVLTAEPTETAFDHIEDAVDYQFDHSHEDDIHAHDADDDDDDVDPGDALAFEAMRALDEINDTLDEQADRANETGLGRFTADAAFEGTETARFLRRVPLHVKGDRKHWLDNLSSAVEEKQRNQRAEQEMDGAERVDNFADDLEGRQRDAYDHITTALANPDAPQLRVAVIGEAGTGKSKLIHAVRKFVRHRFDADAAKVMAYMGCAAYNIYGATIHSTMGLQSQGGTHASIPNDPTILSQARLNRLIRKFQDVKIIIIDEISLVDARMLNAIDVMLRQIKHAEEPFGGFHIVFMGDFYQLPPVDNKPLYKRFENVSRENGLRDIDVACRNGREAWLSVNATFELDINHRQRADTTGFVDILRTIRPGNAPTTDQMNMLRTRTRTLAEAFELADDTALWVTHRNKTRAAINEFDLQLQNERGSKTVHVWASHSRKMTPSGTTLSNRHAGLSRDERRRLTNHNTGDIKPVSHPSLLRLAIGARVALTKNQDYKVGTYNGACGTLVALEYPEGTQSEDLRRSHAQVVNGSTPPVPIALVRFDSIDHKDVNDPEAHTCDDSLGANVVPVLPEMVTVKIDGVSFDRLQLPLVLARATTIHKAQGRTEDTVVYVPEKPFGSGQPYVATSRVRLFNGLIIVLPDGLEDMGVVELSEALFTAHNDQFQEIKIEMDRLRALSPQQPGTARTASRTRRRETTDDVTDAPSAQRMRRHP